MKEKKILKRIMVAFLIAALLSSVVPQFEKRVEAVSIEDSSVFLHQQASNTCTLVAATMMLRRTAILSGCANWNTITEASVKPKGWYTGGLYYNFAYTCDGVRMQVRSKTISGDVTSKKSQLINLLKKYPQGISIYNMNQPHAVLLTKYDAATDTFYCGDSGNKAISPKQILLTQSILNGDTQNEIIEGIGRYWYVESPTVNLKPQLTINYHANGGVIQGSDVTNDTYQVVTSDGLNMRSGAGTNHGVVSWLPKGTTFTVTQTASGSGYTWGKTTYNNKTGWCVISKSGWASKIGSTPVTNFYLSSGKVYSSSTKALAKTTGTYGSVISAQYGLYNITSFGITKEGYTFKGWSTSTSGTPLFGQDDFALKPEDIYPNIKNGSATVVLYAVWENKATPTPTATPTPIPTYEPTSEPTHEPTATPTPEPPVSDIMYGDIDFNGVVEASDALMALQHCVNLIQLDEEETVVGDVNEDKEVTAEDALLILKKTVNLIDKFPVEEPDIFIRVE